MTIQFCIEKLLQSMPQEGIEQWKVDTASQIIDTFIPNKIEEYVNILEKSSKLTLLEVLREQDLK
jgi:hypothetical protein